MFGHLCTSILHRAYCSRISSAPATSQGHKLASILSKHSTQRGQFGRLSSWTNRPDQMNYTSKQSQIPFLKTRLFSFSTRRGLNFRLSQVQINSLLRSNEQSVNVPESDSSVRKFESNQVAANTPNEDRRNAATCLQSKGMLFGVFDGRDGLACVQKVSESLLSYVAVAMMQKQNLEQLERCMDQGTAVPPILQWYNHPSDYNNRESASRYSKPLRNFWQTLLDCEEHEQGLSPSDALDLAFRRLNADISSDIVLLMMTKSGALQAAFAGCMTCVAHVGPDAIHVASSGSCRAVLGVQEEDGSWSALGLDHIPSSLELIKVQQSLSESDTVDMKIKRNLDVTSHKLRPQDRFLILATNGLWDKLSSEEAVRLVGEHLSGIHLQAPVTQAETQRRAQRSPALDTNVTTHLIRHALGKGDNGGLCQEKLATMLSVPEDLAPLYRDDITVTVVYLDSDLAKEGQIVGTQRD